MTRVPVDPKMLQWAYERAGLTPENLTTRFPRLESWLNKDVQPTFKQLGSL